MSFRLVTALVAIFMIVVMVAAGAGRPPTPAPGDDAPVQALNHVDPAMGVGRPRG